MHKSLLVLSVLVLSSVGVAAQAATCGEMFTKAEKMVTAKATAAVDKKVKAYRMAIASYDMCEKAMAMPAGAEKTAMMKDAEREFDKTYHYADGIE